VQKRVDCPYRHSETKEVNRLSMFSYDENGASSQPGRNTFARSSGSSPAGPDGGVEKRFDRQSFNLVGGEGVCLGSAIEAQSTPAKNGWARSASNELDLDAACFMRSFRKRSISLPLESSSGNARATVGEPR
jgi:hypothetical protein